MPEVTSLNIRLPDGRELRLKGREAWTLNALIEAGARGVTPRERPAPRWSHYVYRIRRIGIEVETLRETHGGPYAGHHGRYVLGTPVEVLSIGCANREAAHA